MKKNYFSLLIVKITLFLVLIMSFTFIESMILPKNNTCYCQNIDDRNAITSVTFKTYHSFKEELFKLANIEDSTKRKRLLNQFWAGLKKDKQIPFRINDSVAFLYKGPADTVEWNGDFNAWQRVKSIDTKGKRVGKSDIWILETTLPKNARIDYKIVLNNKNWILDPDNPYQQMSGFGPNSELRMPDWVYPEETIRDKKISRGKLDSNKLISSKYLNYSINYRVYTPKGYDSLLKMPTIYVTDGHEYADDEKGSMLIVLDNLIAKKKIRPVIAVFIDPREPLNPRNNRRQSEYVLNENFVRFVCDELVPRIDSNYKTNKSENERAILGTSLGGINSTYFGFTRPDIFHLIAIQSPAYGASPRLYDIMKNSPRLPLKIFLSTGIIYDGENITRKVRDELEKWGYKICYKEVNEGHSWGNWRALLDYMLIYFWEK
jgi:enterochelin esterase family protein